MPPPYYDATLGGISLPTMNVEGFSETIGGDYELVGAVPMPGPPRPRMYNMVLPIYGDPYESNPYSVGNTMRTQIRDLIENDASRYAGLQFTVTYDTQLNAYLVIGTADLAYRGGPDFGDFELRISGAAVIPAVLVLGAFQVWSADKRLQTTPMNLRTQTGHRTEEITKHAQPRHYLPVGAYDVLGQAAPRLVPTHEYQTIFGPGVYVDDRPHGEMITFEREWDPAQSGDVRVFDPEDKQDVELTKEGDLDPQTVYGWRRVYARRPLDDGRIPILDNGVCRVRHVKDTVFQIETVKNGRYTNDTTFDLGYGKILSSIIDQASFEQAALRLQVGDDGRRGVAIITLQRGWQGPAVDVEHLAKQSKVRTAAEALHEQGEGWEHLRIGAGPTEALFHATQEFHRIRR